MSQMPRTALFALFIALALLLAGCGPAPTPAVSGALPPAPAPAGPASLPTATPHPGNSPSAPCSGCPALPTAVCATCPGVIVNPDLTAIAQAAEPPPTVCTNTPVPSYTPLPSGTPPPATGTPAPGTPNAPVFTRVKVALIAQGGGKIGCGDGVVLVERQISPTQAPLTAAIKELLSLKQQTYGQSGLYNALYQSNLSVQSVSIKDGVATIKLAGRLLIGGACDDPRVEAQFQATARQFSTVRVAEVYVNGTPLADLLSEK